MFIVLWAKSAKHRASEINRTNERANVSRIALHYYRPLYNCVYENLIGNWRKKNNEEEKTCVAADKLAFLRQWICADDGIEIYSIFRSTKTERRGMKRMKPCGIHMPNTEKYLESKWMNDWMWRHQNTFFFSFPTMHRIPTTSEHYFRHIENECARSRTPQQRERARTRDNQNTHIRMV